MKKAEGENVLFQKINKNKVTEMKNSCSFTKVKAVKRLIVLPKSGCVRVYVMWEKNSNKLRIVVKRLPSW